MHAEQVSCRTAACGVVGATRLAGSIRPWCLRACRSQTEVSWGSIAIFSLLKQLHPAPRECPGWQDLHSHDASREAHLASYRAPRRYMMLSLHLLVICQTMRLPALAQAGISVAHHAARLRLRYPAPSGHPRPVQGLTRGHLAGPQPSGPSAAASLQSAVSWRSAAGPGPLPGTCMHSFQANSFVPAAPLCSHLEVCCWRRSIAGHLHAQVPSESREGFRLQLFCNLLSYGRLLLALVCCKAPACTEPK